MGMMMVFIQLLVMPCFYSMQQVDRRGEKKNCVVMQSSWLASKVSQAVVSKHIQGPIIVYIGKVSPIVLATMSACTKEG